MFVLINFLISVALGMVDSMVSFALDTDMRLLGGLYSLAVLVPTIAVGVRRLHDTNRSGLWLLIAFIPLVNLVLLYFFIQEGTRGPNQYGPDPKAGYSGYPASSPGQYGASSPGQYVAPPVAPAAPVGTVVPPAPTPPAAPAAPEPAPVPTPAGWLPDPTGRNEFRYWDATQWTEHVSNAGVGSVDPL